MVEQGLRLDRNPIEDIQALASKVYIRPAFQEIARDYLNPLKHCINDTLVLGCTHYPLLTPLISQVIGSNVRIISSAEETARDVAETLERRGQLATKQHEAVYRFATTSRDLDDYARLGSAILGRPVIGPAYVPVEELRETLAGFEQKRMAS
jgi:glutamate racemase